MDAIRSQLVKNVLSLCTDPDNWHPQPLRPLVRLLDNTGQTMPGEDQEEEYQEEEEEEEEGHNLERAEYIYQFGCDVSFETEFLLNIHYTTRACKRKGEFALPGWLIPMRCRLCAAPLNGGHQLVKHEARQHGAEQYEDLATPWKCHACCIGFLEQRLLYYHLTKMKDERTDLTIPRNSLPPASLFSTPQGPPRSVMVIWRTSRLYVGGKVGGKRGITKEWIAAQNARAKSIGRNLIEMCGLSPDPKVIPVGAPAMSNCMPHIRNEEMEREIRKHSIVLGGAKRHLEKVYKCSEELTEAIRRALAMHTGPRFALLAGLDAYTTC
ncbi:hypothetical protein MBLNU457_g0936t3 [Dothideomycetes sp. NU457]